MTEKNYNPQQQTMKSMQKQEVAAMKKIEATPIGKDEKKEDKVEEKQEEVKKEETKVEEKKQEDKKDKKTGKKIIRKDEAVVNGISLPISTKTSSAICKFIRGKTIEKAILDLEEVLKFKRVIPMTGEIPHKKGKGIMSGRYPIKAIGYFIRMLKNLNANAIVNGIDEGIIVEAIPNRASQPYGRSGAIRRKRTHVKIKIRQKTESLANSSKSRVMERKIKQEKKN